MRVISTHSQTWETRFLNIVNSPQDGFPFQILLEKTPSYQDDPAIPHYLCTVRVPEGDAFLAAGIGFQDQIAKVKAVAEAIERFWLRTPNILSPARSYSEFASQSADPCLWLSTNRTGDGPESCAAREARLRWVRARDLGTRAPRWVPAQQVYVPYPFDDEFLLRRPISTGAAFGRTVQEATLRGLLECIERDAFMIAYLKRWPMPRVRHSRLSEFQKQFQIKGKNLIVFRIRNDFGVATMMAVIIDTTREGPAVSVGLKAGLDPVETALGALLEAHHARFCHRRLFEGREYPQLTDPSDVADVTTRTAFWYRPGSEQHLEYLLGNHKEVTIRKLPRTISLDSLLGRFVRRGYHVYRVLLSREPSPGVVAKILVPELQPLQRVEESGHFISKHLRGHGDSDLNEIPNPFE